MHERRSPRQDLPDRVGAVSALAVLGLRDSWLLRCVRAAVGSAGFGVADVAASANQLLYMAAYRRPQLVVAALEVLGPQDGRSAARSWGVLTRR